MHALFVMGYIALMLVIGLYFSRRKVHDDSDFIVAGRSLSTMVLTATLLATFVGSGSIVGGASFVFQYGPGAAIFFFAGTPIAALVVYFLLAAKMRRSEATTIPGLIEARFGPTARTLASLIILLAYVGIVSYQFTGAGQALNLAFGLPVWQGVLISAAVMIGLATMGVIFRRRPHGVSGVGCTVVWGIGLAGLQGGVEGRLADLEACGGLADVQPIGQVLPGPLQLVVGDDGLATSFTPTGGGSGEPCLGAISDQVALELPQGAEYMEDQPPTGGGGVDGFGQ